MPFPNEHAARQRPPGSFVAGSFRTIKIKGADGVRAIVGKLKSDPDGSMVVQTYRFDRTKWTPARAKGWLRRNGKKDGLEKATGPAGKTKASMSTCCLYDATKQTLHSYVPIDGAQALAVDASLGKDEDGRPLRWVQIARVGSWAGHGQGRFTLDSQKFDAICNNFKTQGVTRVMWDFEHYSEAPSDTATTIVAGMPAQGWSYGFRHDGTNLYALTSWGDLAAQYLKEGKYKGVSPAFIWHTPDRVTGRDVGPTISSIALTNKPFITGMDPPLAASADNMIVLTEDGDAQTLSSSGCALSFDEHMPRIRAALKTHELATPQELKANVARLRSHLDTVNGDPSVPVGGVRLTDYLSPLRELANVPITADWYAVLDIVDDFIDSYMSLHGIKDDDRAYDIGIDELEHEEELAATMSAAELEGAQTMAADTTAHPIAPSAEVSELTLKNAQLETENKKLQEQAQTLSAAAEKERQTQLESKVDRAISCYGQSKGLTKEMRPHLLSFATASPEGFEAMYPTIERVDQRSYLTQNLSAHRVPADAPAQAQNLSAVERATALARAKNIPFADAINMVRLGVV